MDILETFITGIVAIGLVTAFGLHAQNLAVLTKQGGASGSQLLNTAEVG